MPNQPHSSIAPRPEARELLATAIECLIALLDLQEGDPEKEATLGWPNPAPLTEGGADQSHLSPEAQDGDSEPSLGWQNEGGQTLLRAQPRRS
jgi:hypothetical protein